MEFEVVGAVTGSALDFEIDFGGVPFDVVLKQAGTSCSSTEPDRNQCDLEASQDFQLADSWS